MSGSVNRSGGSQGGSNTCPTPSHEPGGNAGDIWLYTPEQGDATGRGIARAQELIGNRSPRGESYSHASINVTDSVVFSDDKRGMHFESQADVIERASTTGIRRIDIMRPIPGGFDSGKATAYACDQVSENVNEYLVNFAGGVPGVCSTAATAAARAGGLPVGERFTTPNDLAADPLLVFVGSYDGNRQQCIPAPPLDLSGKTTKR
jgi:hypothetical protein